MTGNPFAPPEEEPAWRRHPHAPAPGTALGRIEEIGDPGVRALSFGAGRRVFSMLLVRHGGTVHAFLDACPHAFLPLTWRGGSVLSADGQRLVCSNHFAEFDAADGHPVSGPADCGLDALPVRLEPDGAIVMG
ncbi:Rieske (2Fe-2S) protein [Inquilinus limosus]|uniref:Rieske (2Fe-2S) protein n=1 Tax=Inquilinus limosus TaxID=171674 RepID=UPI00068CCCD8|nr:Rieske (2Fe-2S) protein [Inquilinus limosus]